MKLEIEETDFKFIYQVLCRAKLVHELLMTSPDLPEIVRNRHRENAKMANTACDLMTEAISKGGAK